MVNILLIEDNPGDVFIIRRILDDAYTSSVITTAETLEEGLALLCARAFDAVLLDLSLPDSQGFDSIPRIREANESVPIIVLTGIGGRDQGVEALKAGAQDYLLKDQTSGTTLERAIRYAIERHGFEVRMHQTEVEHRHFLQNLRDSLAQLTSTLDLDEVMTGILEHLEKVVAHDAANIALVDQTQALVVRSRNGTGDVRSTGQLFPIKEVPIVAQIIHDGQPAKAQIPHFPRQRGAKATPNSIAYIGAPIVLQGKVQGLINVMRYSGKSFTPDDLERLRIFAEQAAIAMQNARLFQSARELAALEERQRLARELHDSVSQVLFSASMLSEFGIREAAKNPARVQELWTTLHNLIVGALAEMRILLLELRPANLALVELRDLLTQLITALRSRTTLELETILEEIPPLPNETKIAFYRIAQEALNNIAKHSGASHVRCSMKMNGGATLELEIADDGAGFEMSDVDGSSLGLSIMRERAQQIGAQLTISSKPQKGTCVEVRYSFADYKQEIGND